MYDVELDVICEACSIIREFPKDKEVLREQLYIVEKYAGIIRANGSGPTARNTRRAPRTKHRSARA